MKIDAFKFLYDFKGTQIYETVEIDISFSAILDKFCIGRSVLGANHFFYTAQHLEDELYNEEENIFRKFRFRDRFTEKTFIKIPLKINKKAKIINGIIAYDSEESLINFFKKHINMSINCKLSSIIKECRGENGKINFDIFIMRKLNEIMNNEKIFIDKRKTDLMQHYYMFTKNSDKYLIEKHEYGSLQRIFVIEKITKIDSYNIPIINFIYHGLDDKKNEGIFVLYYENEIKVYEKFYDINPFILNKFDNEGKLYSATKIDLLPDNSKEVFAILRVPTKQEYREYKKTNNKINKINEIDILNKVFFVSPSLKAVRLKPDIKVIDDIDIFEKIYSKLSSSIYIPNNLSMDINCEILPEKEQFLFLERPI